LIISASVFGRQIAAAVLDTDTESAAIDLSGYYVASFLISVGVGGITFDADNKLEFILTHSDDDVAYEAVDATDVDKVASVGDLGEVLGFTAEHAAAASYIANYVGGKRYVKVKAEFTGTHGTGTPVSVACASGAGERSPETGQPVFSSPFPVAPCPARVRVTGGVFLLTEKNQTMAGWA
jgi:hypothetical protein